MTLPNLKREAVTLAGLIDGARVLFEQCATEPCPASNAMIPLLEEIAKKAHRLANDLDAAQRQKLRAN